MKIEEIKVLFHDFNPVSHTTIPLGTKVLHRVASSPCDYLVGCYFFLSAKTKEYILDERVQEIPYEYDTTKGSKL